MAELTDQEKLQIAQHYLLSSPPGQFNDVLGDVRKLLPSGLLTDAVLSGICRVYNTNHRISVPIAGSDHKAMISLECEVDPTHYLDLHGKRIFGFDHINRTVVETDIQPAGSQLDAGLEPKREALHGAVDAYLRGQFTAESRPVSAVASKGGQLHVAISAERLNLRNFWSGAWMSSWQVRVTGASAHVTGGCKLHVHYFEDGNVQLTNHKDAPPADIPFTSTEEFAAKVTAHIQNFEGDLQGALEEMYTNMSKDTFKAMRRVMPLTQTKMDWNPAAHRMVRTIRK